MVNSKPETGLPYEPQPDEQPGAQVLPSGSRSTIATQRRPSMTTARAILVVGAMLAAAILGHALLMRPPRYQMVQLDGSHVTRLDMQTGTIALCEPYRFTCSTE
jgi:hypothetical protein